MNFRAHLKFFPVLPPGGTVSTNKATHPGRPTRNAHLKGICDTPFPPMLSFPPVAEKQNKKPKPKPKKQKNKNRERERNV